MILWRTRSEAGRLAGRLAALEAGQAHSEQALGQESPDEAALRSLAALAMELRQMPTPAPAEDFRADGRRRLLLAVAAEPRPRRRPGPLTALARPAFAGKQRRLAPVWLSAVAAAFLCLGAGGAAVAAGGALPGDPLYGVKTGVEAIRLAVAPVDAEAALYAHLAERRLAEIQALAARNRLDDVPQAAAAYERQVGQALAALAVTASREDATSVRQVADLDQMLAEQAATLQALAGQAPAAIAPVIRQAQSVSAGAQNAIRQMRGQAETGDNGPDGAGQAEPTPTPPPITPQPERPHPQATPAPADPTPAGPPPGPERPTPAGDHSRLPDPTPAPPAATPPAAPLAPARPRPDTPAPAPTTEDGAAATPPASPRPDAGAPPPRPPGPPPTPDPANPPPPGDGSGQRDGERQGDSKRGQLPPPGSDSNQGAPGQTG